MTLSSDQQCQLILASASPRRRELLTSMGVDFKVRPADIDETRHSQETPTAHVQRLAREKAVAVFTGEAQTETAVLGADTIVVFADQVFGKPKDFEHAKSMWQTLSERSHFVMTAICLVSHDTIIAKLVSTEVQFAAISEPQMHRYWASEEPQDKAGGYAIQGLGSVWVQQIKGSYSNVVGLPLREVNELLSTIGRNWL